MNTTKKLHKPTKGRMKAIVLCTVRRLTALLVAYYLGYWGWSVAWLLLITSIIVVLKDRSSQRKLRVQAAKERELLILKKSAIDEKLPNGSLLETADWLNKVISQLWPHLLQYLTTKVREDVESNIRATLEKCKLGGNFNFQKMNIGGIPLQLGALQVLQDSGLNEIIICADVVYESECDVTFVWRGVKGGMKNFQIRGRAHLVLRPLVDKVPFVAGYHVVFPEKPVIQYQLSGVGYFLDIPGLRDIVHHIITKRVCTLLSAGYDSDYYSSQTYKLLIEKGEVKENELSVPTVSSDEILTPEQITAIDRAIQSQSSVHGEIVVDLSSPKEKTVHNHLLTADKEKSNPLMLSGDMPDQLSISNEATHTQVKVEMRNHLAASCEAHHWSSISGVSTHDETLTSDNPFLNQQLTDGTTIHDSTSVSDENACNRPSVSSDTTRYNIIPKPSRTMKPSVSEIQDDIQEA